MSPKVRYDRGLTDGETLWRDRYDWLLEAGYVLRPRYKPGWVPSWRGTNKYALNFEDGWMQKLNYVLDAVRKSDGEMVMLKRVSRTVHPFEVPIGQYLCSPSLATEPRNHCCPILEVLQDPVDSDIQIVVMPLLKEHNIPPQLTIGEAVDFFRQAFEGLQFMHQHHVAHRDCMTLNIMMDPRNMYPDMFHPIAREYDRNVVGPAKHYSRTVRPTRYYWTDFGLSCQFDANDANPLAIPIVGGDTTVPEYLEDETTPRNPFHTDVYTLGNLIREDFLQIYSNLTFMEPLVASMVVDKPDQRITMDEAVRQLDTIISQLPSLRLRQRLRQREDNGFIAFLREVQYAFRMFYGGLWLHPAIPRPPPPSQFEQKKTDAAGSRLRTVLATMRRRFVPVRKQRTPVAP
ncbi:hypothetical protein BD309DRAFT_922657 [Dichomitus squalens]|uniref:Uncharacterized protein n=2 Tax=Dichomitus squalens TaxID=114155 RepID=A0A4Q9Q9Z7_9APHY|nr:uncharacterized protein DICSQDRAFT_111483 [Dichomitus squalens LYAD-421 SS1]EJF57674.1 hypothetical protein DICSQDRAFT_111483 [Dichomitus squalens LYAD-421 SS1]TBU42955.1 hypothetical protein BD309DRAFT_922657 [Dichomitus squalens]TBU64365.1 hypothetical protein BD310DRAFT_964178 [Dichomitus squalens]